MVKALRAFKDYSAATRPFRAHVEIEDLEVEGEIPCELDGTFYRVMQDPYYERDWFMGGSKATAFEEDASISAFRVKNGKAAFKQRYVLTERLLAERKAGGALFGIAKASFTHHPCVRALVDGAPNTNVIVHAGKLLALGEGGAPYDLDPNTMATGGYDPFPGQLPYRKPYTAHPHVNPKTGELVGFGYNLKGVESPDVALHLYFDTVLASANTLTFLPTKKLPNKPKENEEVSVVYAKFQIDPEAKTDTLEDPAEERMLKNSTETLVDVPCEFPRIDERFLTEKKGDGFLITMIDNIPEGRNEVIIQDTRDFQKVVARIILPFRKPFPDQVIMLNI
ncbi:hypothetical protein SLS56_001736 [Neofusicoccum ribis]|uniref:Lignostilbene dioxygenase n=1 Tax=Neofusicoccum ribis TaxID=45134 RepID=A0ABR3T7H0_9PEZI